jgi:hypothetical protein
MASVAAVMGAVFSFRTKSELSELPADCGSLRMTVSRRFSS